MKKETRKVIRNIGIMFLIAGSILLLTGVMASDFVYVDDINSNRTIPSNWISGWYCIWIPCPIAEPICYIDIFGKEVCHTDEIVCISGSWECHQVYYKPNWDK